jgi:hypothetical protein
MFSMSLLFVCMCLTMAVSSARKETGMILYILAAGYSYLAPYCQVDIFFLYYQSLNFYIHDMKFLRLPLVECMALLILSPPLRVT